MDVLCQAKSGMGKTAVFVLSILQQIDPKEGEVSAIVLCHTRELAYQVCFVYVTTHNLPLSSTWNPDQYSSLQITHEFTRFSVHMRDLKDRIANFFGGLPVEDQRQQIKKKVPAIVVGTPGRIKQVRC